MPTYTVTGSIQKKDLPDAQNGPAQVIGLNLQDQQGMAINAEWFTKATTALPGPNTQARRHDRRARTARSSRRPPGVRWWWGAGRLRRSAASSGSTARTWRCVRSTSGCSSVSSTRPEDSRTFMDLDLEDDGLVRQGRREMMLSIHPFFRTWTSDNASPDARARRGTSKEDYRASWAAGPVKALTDMRLFIENASTQVSGPWTFDQAVAAQRDATQKQEQAERFVKTAYRDFAEKERVYREALAKTNHGAQG
jgi:hypothetical protein